MKKQILVEYGMLDLSVISQNNSEPANISLVGTLLSNLAHYGFVPSKAVLEVLNHASDKELKAFWKEYEPILKIVTGSNRNMSEFVVYKNFPKEVLEKTHAEYWISQILMYWGVANEYFTQKEEVRDNLFETQKLKVLNLANENSLTDIYSSLKANSSRWNDKQMEHALFLGKLFKPNQMSLTEFSFKENGIILMNSIMSDGVLISIENATDILRLASCMSNGDVSLRISTKFRNFSRKERKFILSMLENSKNLLDDVTLRPEVWKKLFKNLHPGDYNFKQVKFVYDAVYRNHYTTFNSEIEAKIENKDKSVLAQISSRTGEFLRRFHKLYAVFGMDTVNSFVKILDKLETNQLLKFNNYIVGVNQRNQFIYAPRGNWTKAQFAMNEKAKLSQEALSTLTESICKELNNRLSAIIPDGVDLDLSVDNIKLQTNDQKLANYGRGTVFNIPENMTFIRSASYWSTEHSYNVWFDNGWNFFDENWQGMASCCWDSHQAFDKAAIFSGDPTNSKDMAGRACQMIDLYIDKLLANGVRYAVWNILAFSHVSFDQAKDVLATLQWGEEAQTGNLYEPSRAQMVFPIKGSNFTKYIAYIDLVERKLVYMDANLYGNVRSANTNLSELSIKMPAFIEYLKSLPSVADLFINANKGTTKVLYSDENVFIKEGDKAYVFQKTNPNNNFTQLDLNNIV